MSETTHCPFCGQALIDKRAAERLGRSQATFEREIRALAQAEADAQLKQKVEGARKAASAAADAEAKKLRRQVERKQDALDKLKQKHAAERRRVEESIRAELESKQANKERQLQRTVARLEDQKDELERRVERLGAQDRGDSSEGDLFGRLSRAFPEDEIKRRGRGGDVLHTVRYRAGHSQQEAGLILYECKDTLRWLNAFVEQIKRDGKRMRTPYLVLVSRAFPRNEKWICVRDDVVIVHPAHALYLASVMRRMAIETDRAGLAAEGPGAKTALLFEYLTSEDFRQTFRAVLEAGGQLTDLLQRERTAHERTWARREHAYNDLARKASAIDENIRTIIEAEAITSGKVVDLRARAG